MSILTKTAKVITKAAEIEAKVSAAILVVQVSYMVGKIGMTLACKGIDKYKKAHYQNPHVLDKL